MLYRLSNVTRVFGGRTVVDIESLAIAEGGCYALLGPNGAGKSTLLDMLAFLERPSRGAIEFRSNPVDFSRKELHRLRQMVVMVDQNPILFTATVFQNVAFGLKARRVPANERKKRANEALERVGMSAFSDAMAHRLSGGETQRVALARALAVAPKVLLCDEPTANVDSEHQGAILRILREINREQNISLIFTTHDRSHAAALAVETLYLDRGRLTSAGQENVFAATLKSGSDGRGICQIDNGPRMSLPYDGTAAVARRVRIEIDPARILLEPEACGRTSKNRFPAKVLRLAEERDLIWCVVDVGVWLGIHLSKSAYRKIRPLVGDTVSIQIPADAVRLI